MTIAIFNPYGSAARESGFLLVLARYLLKRGFPLVNLRCSGVIPDCHRLDSLKERSFTSCIECMNESDKNSSWSELPAVDLSPYFSGKDYQRFLNLVTRDATLARKPLVVEGISLAELIEDGGKDLLTGGLLTITEPSNIALIVNAARVVTAFSQLLEERAYDGVFLPSNSDLYIKALAVVAAKRNIPLFTLRWVAEKRSMEIDGGGAAKTFYSELVFDSIDSLRSDVKSWPEQITAQLRSIEEYLGITQQQLSLPMH